MSETRNKHKAFTLMELLAVVSIILVLMGVAVISFSRARPSVKVRTDAATMVSFLRNMWELTKANGAPLVLNPDYEKGTFSYFDPRTGREETARFSSKARVIGIRLNDRFYSASAYVPPGEETTYSGHPDDAYAEALYISEGRGLSSITVVFALGDDDALKHITSAQLSLVTGKGKVETLSPEMLDQMLMGSEEGT